ncbi:hypothetical protein M9Y10_023882 [Tritrichomonas musculus]|uniref:DH domain-containing protein n=1 Tax=Tritrichomonas musculus TaxID=1915356 RepID=A0ABR2KWC6_9EUKA
MSRADKSKIDQIVKNEPRLNKVVPMSYFIVPFQRIPKYPLFLRDLINNTPKCHPDSNFLNLALNSIKTVWDKIEYSKESAEDQQKLNEIFMRTSKKVNLLDPRRRLLDQINGKLKSNGWKSIFHIFNDMVLLTMKLSSTIQKLAISISVKPPN